ncbi:MAG: CBS domain-containing protein [Desulfurococcales archaeon]|nr:CBS domain-containing protein [Desulfurococcales archaeon]
MPAITVSSIMSKNIYSLNENRTVADAARVMKETKTGSILVVNPQGVIVGVVTERDLVYKVLAEGRDAQTRLKDIMTRDIKTVKPSSTLAEAAKIMIEMEVRHIPVVDEAGRPVGILSIRDLIESIWGD